ncbi:hypothetical protein [Oceanobacillus jeddahense]|uniref:ABC transporter permease n=1 Tax=Oceanobacillus jeddahense TaxID=1462527 RepID=A0ABY5K088_9BACI|nr:hypothetical protein [Oceanobacillus jeddahense]UUI04507.1 hypothetical protein NP439_07595 [Oceanobacillus jeddahense]
MNQKIWILFKNDLANSIPLHDLFRSGKQGNGGKITAVVLLLMGILLLTYNILTAKTLVSLGQTAMIPGYMLSVSSIMMVFLSLLRANGTIFGSSDFEQLAAYPVSEKEIFISKLLHLYFFNLLIGLLFSLPVLFVWATNALVSPILIILFCITALVAPVIPICIGVIFGSLVYRMAAYFRQMNLIAVCLSLCLLGAFSYFIMTQSNQTDSMQDIGTVVYSQMTAIYLPSVLFQFSSIADSFSILIFLFISGLLFLVLTFFGSRYYRRLNLRLLALKSTNHMKPRTIKQRRIFVALWKKEITALFSSYNYLLNSILGTVLLVFISMALLLFGFEKLTKIIPLPVSIETVANLFPMVVAAMLLINNPAAAALSMEGNKVWILKTLPIEQKKVVHAKLACTFSLHFIGFAISILAYIIRLSPTIEQLIWAILIPVSYSAFITTFGLMLIYFYPHFSWKNDMYIVKQSPPVLIAAFTGMALMIVPLVLILFQLLPLFVIYLALCILLLGLAVYFYQRTCTIKFI